MPELLLSDEIVVPSSAFERLRELVLGVVVRPEDLTLTGGSLSSVPIAGVARLIVEVSEHRSDVSVNAWVSARWTSSTVEFISFLEPCFSSASERAQKAGQRSSALALVDQDIAVADGESLRAIAAICGYNLITFGVASFHGAAMNAVRLRPPTLLLVQSTVLGEARPLINLFSQATPRKPILLSANSIDSLRTALRTRLSEAAGVSSGLFLVGNGVEEEEDDGYAYVTQNPLPVKRQGKKAHHRKFRIIVECLEAELWYSRDNSDHAQTKTVAFKSFKAGIKGLEWVADLDEHANIIDKDVKHKGPVGLLIPWNELSIDSDNR